MHQEFAIAFRAGDGRFDDAHARQSYCTPSGRDFLDDARVNRGIPDEASTTDVIAAGLELRLHERHDVSRRARAAAGRRAGCG